MNDDKKEELHVRYRECLQQVRVRSSDDQVLAKIALDREILDQHYGEPDEEAWNHRVSVLHAASLRRTMEIESRCRQTAGISKGAFEAQLVRELARGLFPADHYRWLAHATLPTLPARRRRQVRHG